MKAKEVLFSLIIITILFSSLEVILWLGGKFYYARHPSPVKEVNLFFSRGHPLFTDNSDLKPDGVEFDEITNYRFGPNSSHFRKSFSYNSVIEVDSEGFVHNGDPVRNKRLLSAPRDTLFRVVMLGGSTTAGRGASDNSQTIAAHLQKRMEKRWPESGISFHVINAGVWGYNSTQERLFYSYYIRPLKPDIVIFLDGTNDSFISATHADWRPRTGEMSLKKADYNRLATTSGALAMAVKNLTSFPQPLYTIFAIDKLLGATGLKPGAPPSSGEKPTFVFHEGAVENLRKNLVSIAHEAQEDETDAFFVLQPILSESKRNLSSHEMGLIKKNNSTYDRYGETNAMYWKRFSTIYTAATTHNRIPAAHFHDMSHVFDTTPEHIYESSWHYNNLGNDMISSHLLSLIQGAVESKLAARPGAGPHQGKPRK